MSEFQDDQAANENEVMVSDNAGDSIAIRLRKNSPLLPSENPEEFAQFQLRCVNEIRPANIVEEIYLMEFISYSWDIWRLQRVRSVLLSNGYTSGVAKLLSRYGYADGDGSQSKPDNARALAEAAISGEPGAAKTVDDFLADHGSSRDSVVAILFDEKTIQLEFIERLLTFYSMRRDKSLKLLDQRRYDLARRARDLAANVEDAQFVETPGKAKAASS